MNDQALSRKWTVLLAMVCGVAVANVYAMQPLLPLAGHDLRIAHGTVGWLIAAAQLGYLVGLVTLVPLGDVHDRRRLIAAHLVLTALGAATTAVSPSAGIALLGLGIAGVFATVVQTTVAYAASQAPPERRGSTVGAVTSGVVAGILGARVISGALAQLAGWRSVYVALAAACLIAALAVLTLLPADDGNDRVSYRQALISEVRLIKDDRLFLSRGVIAFFLFASFGTLWSGLALPLAAAPRHLDASQIGLFGLAGVLGAFGAGRAGRWADRGRATTVTIFSLAALIGSWGLCDLLSQSLWLLIGGVLVLDFAVQAVHVSNQHFLTRKHPDQTSTAIGGYMAFYSCGSALGAISTTAVHATGGWSAQCVLGAMYATAALITAIVSRAAGDQFTTSTPADSRRQATVRT